MIHCKDCQYFEEGAQGRMQFKCDPFRTVVEPECLSKWLLMRIEVMVRSHQATVEHYRQLAPLQERIFKYMKREMDDMDESEKWKQDEPDEDGFEMS